MIPTIDADRLWQSHMDMARIGAAPEGGSNRPAYSPGEAAAHALLLSWCGTLGLAAERDAMGNSFFRRPGTVPRPAVAFGSHLDTVPAGGRFDGVFGVLAGLEVLRALHGVPLAAPLELAVWTNEEGARFPPAMMGSRVHAGDLTLAQALATRDDSGITVAEALAATGQAGPLPPGRRDWACWIEPHIEQGPILEDTGDEVGIVVGTVHARYLSVTLQGEPSHVGATAMASRHDTLAAAAEIVLATEALGRAAEPLGRSSAAWIENRPNARGAVPDWTCLHCDMRHEDPDRTAAMEAELRAAIAEIAGRRGIRMEVDRYATFGPAPFDAGLCAVLRDAAQARQLRTRDMKAAAGHDAVLLARLYPTAMLFVPSLAGISHNPAEHSSPEQLARGAQVLLDAVLHLAA